MGAVREQSSISGESLLQDAVKGEREEFLVPKVWWETRKSEEEAGKGQGRRQPLHVLCSGGLYGFSVTCQLVTATLSSIAGEAGGLLAVISLFFQQSPVNPQKRSRQQPWDLAGDRVWRKCSKNYRRWLVCISLWLGASRGCEPTAASLCLPVPSAGERLPEQGFTLTLSKKASLL